ncbi:MAG: hypothetical protein H7338_09170 [Candidatus Sericytochromatia bacterium]|nr:hypothetical protein [Candidatus Sericytochromatia bacterium]
MSDLAATTVTLTDPRTGQTTTLPAPAAPIPRVTVAAPAAGTTVTTGNGVVVTTQAASSGSDKAAGVSRVTTQPITHGSDTAGRSDVGAGSVTVTKASPLAQLAGREPFLYAGLGLFVLTLLVLAPMARRRPQWRVRMGLPYLIAFGLVSYAVDGDWIRALGMVVACLLIVFGMTVLRLWRWRIPRKLAVHSASVDALRADAFSRKIEPALTGLGFVPEAGYQLTKPDGSLAVLTYRHKKDPVIAHVRLVTVGARRYPHLVFATRLRGGEQVWTWNHPGTLPPQPSQWRSYHHAAIQDPAALFALHQRHLAERPAVYVADKESDTAKRIQLQADAELQAQAAAGWLTPTADDRYKLTAKAIWQWTGSALLAFLGIPLGRLRVTTRG